MILIVDIWDVFCVYSHQQVKRHGCYLWRVLVSVLLRDPGGHHMGVIDRVHLHNRPVRGQICPSANMWLLCQLFRLYHLSHLEDVILAQATVKHFVE